MVRQEPVEPLLDRRRAPPPAAPRACDIALHTAGTHLERGRHARNDICVGSNAACNINKSIPEPTLRAAPFTTIFTARDFVLPTIYDSTKFITLISMPTIKHSCQTVAP